MLAPSLSFPKYIPSLSGINLSEAVSLATLISTSVKQLVKLAEACQSSRNSAPVPNGCSLGENGNKSKSGLLEDAHQKDMDSSGNRSGGGGGGGSGIDGTDIDAAANSSVTNVDQGSEADTEAEAEALEAKTRMPLLQIVAACSQLAALVRAPEQSVMEAATGYHLSAALRLVVEANVIEVIRERGEENQVGEKSLHVQEIARICNLDQQKLARILRLLATHHIFLETAPNTFANNRLSAVLDSGAPLSEIMALPSDITGSTPGIVEEAKVKSDEEAIRVSRWQKKYGASTRGAGLAALIAITTDESMHHATALADTLMSPPPGIRADDPRAAPFSRSRLVSPGIKALGSDQSPEEDTMFNWLSNPARKHRLVRFGCAMQGMGALTPGHAILRGFNWGALPEGARVVDVGGGVGASALQVVRAYPSLRVTVQDMKEVVEEAPKVWETWCPEALRDGRVSFKAQNFFEPQSSLKHCAPAPAVFLLRMIMHNWPDAECETILRHVRAAAKAGGHGEEPTKLVIVDSILMHACREKSKDENLGAGAADDGSAPEPLLANWGTANGLAYKLDLQMLNNHNAGERTLEEFEQLLARTGWRIVAVHAAAESWMPQIVAVPEPAPVSAKNEEKKDVDDGVSMAISASVTKSSSAPASVSEPTIPVPISKPNESNAATVNIKENGIIGLVKRNKPLPAMPAKIAGIKIKAMRKADPPLSPQQPKGLSPRFVASNEEQSKKMLSLERRGSGKRQNLDTVGPRILGYEREREHEPEIKVFTKTERKATATSRHPAHTRRGSRSRQSTDGRKTGEWVASVAGKLPARLTSNSKSSLSITRAVSPLSDKNVIRISLEDKIGVSVPPGHGRRSSLARARARWSTDSHKQGVSFGRKSSDRMQAFNEKAQVHSRGSSRSPSPAPAPPVRVPLPLEVHHSNKSYLTTTEFDTGMGASTSTTTLFMGMDMSCDNTAAAASAAYWTEAIGAEAQAHRDRGECECGCGTPMTRATAATTITTTKVSASQPTVPRAKRQKSFWRLLIPGAKGRR